MTSAGCAPGPSPEPEPCPGWPGWETWDDFAPDCEWCVPASRDALPEPIEWEPCDEASGVPEGCRQMRVTWPTGGSPFAYSASVDVNAAGQAVLDVTRIADDPGLWGVMNVVAEADGAVLSAMMDTRQGSTINGNGCYLYLRPLQSLRQGWKVRDLRESSAHEDYPLAVVGGPADELHPKVQWQWGRSNGHLLAASDYLWATTNPGYVGVGRWGQGWEQILHSSEVGGLEQVQPTAWHDFVAWMSSNVVYVGIMAWTPERGAFPLITYPNDWARGAECLGTDGLHMVWTYGEGRQSPDEWAYPVRSVMVSPFTKDPAGLQPTRLRSYPTSEPGIVPWVVGCGYGAHRLEDNRVIVVRLSDGWSWTLLGPPPPDAGPSLYWHFDDAFAVTCEELFVRGGIGADFNIARVRLDALGPGEPPD